jgi:hypothetical protein
MIDIHIRSIAAALETIHTSVAALVALNAIPAVDPAGAAAIASVEKRRARERRYLAKRRAKQAAPAVTAPVGGTRPPRRFPPTVH